LAARSLGVLTLDLIAKIGGFVSGMTAAERAADKSAKKIEASVKAIGVAGYAVGEALGQYLVRGVDLVAAAFPKLIDQAAQFQDIAEKTGGSAEGLASFAVAAGVAGADINTISAASIKLTKNLTGVDDESKAAGAALKALNIPIAEFKKLAPEEQLERVAKELATFKDGAGKTAVAVDLLGKSGAELLPFLKALAELGRQKILTDEQIQAADAYADQLGRAKAELTLYAAAAATQALPATTALTSVVVDLVKEFTGLSKEATALGTNSGVKIFAQAAGEFLAELLDRFVTTKREFGVLADFFVSTADAAGKALSFDFQGAGDVGRQFRARYGLDEMGRKVVEDSGKAAGRTYVQQFRDQLAQGARSAFSALDPRRTDLGKSGKPVDPRGTLNYRGATSKSGGGGGDDPTKKLLDNDLKAFQAQADQAKELLGERNRILDLYNAQGLVSVKDYYAALQGNLDEATAAQMKSLDDQIKALQDYKAKAPKETDRADAQGKINDLLTKQAKLQRESGVAAIEMGVKQQQAAQAYRDSLNEVNAKILELDGNLGKAAEIRFDVANRQLRALAEASGDFASVAQIDRLRAYTTAQADLNSLQQKFSLAQGDLSIAEERITLARERGTMGEIESLRASGDARKAAIALMQQQLEKFQAIDAAARTPEQAQAIERLKVQLEGLKATVDPLADKFNTLFSDAAGNAFGDFITGTKTAKDAFKDFSNTVISEMSRIAAKDLAKSLFGGGGQATGGVGFNFGSLLSGFFGGSSSGGGDALGSFITAKGFSGGGFTGVGAANDPAGIVHKNEYVLTAKQTRQIGVANLDRGNFGGGTYVTNVSVEGRIDRQTRNQIANEVSLEQRRARRLA
jgi:hypothetical protein